MPDDRNPVRKRHLVVTRLFNAPVESVWKCWSDPNLIMRWWGPDLFTSPSCKVDFREGGTSVVCMRSPQGQDFYSIWKYVKIVPLQHLEFTQNMSDESGHLLDPAKLGLPPEFPRDTRTVIVFKAKGGKTEMTMTEYNMPAPDTEMGKFAELGLNQTLDKMVALFFES